MPMFSTNPFVLSSRKNFDAAFGHQERHIGEGAFSIVKKTNKGVAIKVSKSNYEIRVNALREAAILRNVSHSSVVRVAGVLLGKQVRVALELWPSSLKPLFENSKQAAVFESDSVRASVLAQLLSALAYCHAHNVLHCDIKPENILARHIRAPVCTVDVALADFGVAQVRSKQKQQSDNVGTIWWRAPELFLGTTVYGGEIDIWALGVVALELLAIPRMTDVRDTSAQNTAMIISRFADNVAVPFFNENTRLYGPIPCSALDTPELRAALGHTMRWKSLVRNSNASAPRFARTLTTALDSTDASVAERTLIKGMLQINPKERLTAANALQSKFLSATLENCHDTSDLAAFSAGSAVGDYMTTRQSDLNSRMRFMLLFWLFQVCIELKLSLYTWTVGVHLLDRFLILKSTLRSKLQLMGCAAMYIACQLHEQYAPVRGDFVYWSDQSFTIREFDDAVDEIIAALDCDLYRHTVLDLIAGRSTKRPAGEFMSVLRPCGVTARHAIRSVDRELKIDKHNVGNDDCTRANARITRVCNIFLIKDPTEQYAFACYLFYKSAALFSAEHIANEILNE